MIINKFMRKIKQLVFFFLLSGLTFGACGNQPKSENIEVAENSTETPKENISTNTPESGEVNADAASKGKPVYLTKADFLTKVADYEKNPNEWKYLGDKPAIIDFYADWCGPCKVIAPVLEQLATEYKDQIYIYKINVDKETELAQAFGIQSIPSLLFIPMKDSPQMARGALPKDDLKKAINEVSMEKLCLLRDIYRTIRDFVVCFQQKHNLCLNEGMLLCSLKNKEKLSASDIAEVLGLTTSNASKIIRQVEEKNLVERIIGREDKRQMYFVLTENGRNKLNVIKEEDMEIEFLLLKIQSEVSKKRIV